MSHTSRNFFVSALTLTMLLLAGNFIACEPEDLIFEVDCYDCFGYPPDTAELIVYVTMRLEQDSVPLTFFRGDSNGEVDWQDTAVGEEFRLDARIGSTYTVQAEYRSGSKTIIAFDSDEMTLNDYGDQCGDPCYIIKGGIYDVRLKE